MQNEIMYYILNLSQMLRETTPTKRRTITWITDLDDRKDFSITSCTSETVYQLGPISSFLKQQKAWWGTLEPRVTSCYATVASDKQCSAGPSTEGRGCMQCGQTVHNA